MSENFSNALSFSCAHLAGLCRRKQVLKLFEEDESNAVSASKCCDVCEGEISELSDKKTELALLVSAIDELGNKGEVKVTEWIRGGELAWMEEIEVSLHSVYGKGSSLSKQWWRNFIRQAAAAGYISRIIKTASFGTSNGAYAQLNVTERTRDLIASDVGVLLPEFVVEKEIVHNSKVQLCSRRKREGKGHHMVSTVRLLLNNKENWKDIHDKDDYHYPGAFSEPSSNVTIVYK